MAELRFDLLANLNKLDAQLKKYFKQKFDMGAKGGGGSGGSGGGSAVGFLGKIAKIVGPIAIITAAVSKINSVFKVIDLALNFMVLGVFKLIKFWQKFFTNIPAAISVVWEKIKPAVEIVKEKLLELKNKAIEKILELKDRFVAKVGELKDKLVQKVIDIKDSIIEKVREAWEKIVEWLKTGWDTITSNMVEIKDSIAEKIVALREKLSEVIVGIRDKVIERFNIIKEKLVEFKNSAIAYLKDLPGRIWDKIKQLGSIIASSIKNLVKDLNPVSKVTDFFGGKKNVSDAIVTSDGKVIQTSPRDTIIATQNPGGMGGSRVVNLYGVTSDEVVDRIKRELGMTVNRGGRF